MVCGKLEIGPLLSHCGIIFGLELHFLRITKECRHLPTANSLFILTRPGRGEFRQTKDWKNKKNQEDTQIIIVVVIFRRIILRNYFLSTYSSLLSFLFTVVSLQIFRLQFIIICRPSSHLISCKTNEMDWCDGVGLDFRSQSNKNKTTHVITFNQRLERRTVF